MEIKLLCSAVLLLACISGIVCPPVNPKPVEGGSPDEEVGFGLHYDRYLREVVMALEEDEEFRKKLEEANITDIKSGKIAMFLDMVSHSVRERLDEIKRTEISRLRMLARQKMKAMNGLESSDAAYPHHVDTENPHSFEMKDLEKLIIKATSDLDEIDKQRRGEFKEYEMRKEHERQEHLKTLDEQKRREEEENYEQQKKKHRDHPKVKHPGSKQQLEEVWEKTDHMDPDDFDPKTFFKMHDMDGNNILDQDEVEALFQKELDKVYDPDMPEDDMRERYEDMARMREHVFSELDKDKDRMISLDEFINYTNTQEFEKDDGWQGVDEQEAYTDEEFQRYEQMLKDQQAVWEARNKGLGVDPNMQPGVVPSPMDPNVQHMQQGQGMPVDPMAMQDHLQQQGMPQGQGGMHPAQGGMPPAHAQGMPQQGGMPPAHGGMPPAHAQGMPQQGGMPPAQGGMSPAHGGMPQQGGMPPAHAQGMPQQGGMPPAHGQGMPQQGGMPPAHGQGIPQQGGMPPSQGQPLKFEGQPAGRQQQQQQHQQQQPMV